MLSCLLVVYYNVCKQLRLIPLIHLVPLVDITGLSVTITPKYATSKVLVMFNVHIVGDDSGTGLRLLRGSTTLSIGDASSNRKMTAIDYFSNNTSPSAYNGGLTSHVILDCLIQQMQQLINYKDKSYGWF